jgi:hypothetical protein
MATVWDHLSVEELEERFGGCEDATASRQVTAFGTARAATRGAAQT